MRHGPSALCFGDQEVEVRHVQAPSPRDENPCKPDEEPETHKHDEEGIQTGGPACLQLDALNRDSDRAAVEKRLSGEEGLALGLER